MHVIIVGCGRVGSTLATRIADGGNSVVVIDRRADAFRRLPADFPGRTIAGVGFDRDVLGDAGVRPDAAVLAVTSGDNSNILVARVARETFGVERVIARIYDPNRAAIFERLGIPTVASVAWTAERVLHYLNPSLQPQWLDPTAQLAMIELQVPSSAAGLPVAALDEPSQRVVAVTRLGVAALADSQSLLQQDDVIHLAVAAGSIDSVSSLWQRAAHRHEGVH
jgi:trk system potassium uptake protein TrkA